LVADETLDVICPFPAWGNYSLLFGMQGGGRLLSFPFFDESGRYNLAGLRQQLDRAPGKAVVILNFPNNPTGYVPSLAELDDIAEVVADRTKPTVAICDDAYAGWVYDDARTRLSPYWALAKRANPEHLTVFKVDGATKELVFFSSRVGFLTHTLTGAAATALESKLKCHIRGTVGCAPGPSLALLDQVLKDPNFDQGFERHRRMMARRAQVLRDALDTYGSPRLVAHPFHGAFFALVKVPGDPEALRQTLLSDHGAGVIAFP
jgi:aspartate/methionine/tyrosine aminotransferase